MITTSQLNLFAAAMVTEPARPPAIIERPPPRNYRLIGDRNLGATWGERAHANLAAIELMQQIVREGRHATPEEQAKLIQFTGFGATALATSLFPVGSAPPRAGFEKLHEWLHRTVDEPSIRRLARSTQYAHYTPEPIVREAWRAIMALGFNGGRVLEPGCGTGLYFALVPEVLADLCQFVGIEAEPITAQIAALIHPQATIREADFTNLSVMLGQPYDLAIGNPPFSNRVVTAKDISLSLHEFFIYRSLQNLKPGALAAFVVSRYLMDKGESEGRKAISRLADFIGGVRLPAGSMRARSGTDVVVDLVFLRRRRPEQDRAGHPWIDLTGVAAGNARVAINEYFAQNPDQVLGGHAIVSSQYGPAYSCVADKAKPWLQALPSAIDSLIAQKSTPNIPENITDPVTSETERPEAPDISELFPLLDVKSVAEGGTIREGSYLVDQSDRLCRVIGGQPIPVDIRGVNAISGMTKAHAAAVRSLIPIRDALRAVLQAQEEGRPWHMPLIALRQAYDAFVTELVPVREGKRTVMQPRGPINYTKTIARNVTRKVKRVDEETGEEITEKVAGISYSYQRPNLGPMSLDPDVWLVASVEDYDLESEIGTLRTDFRVRRPATREVKSAADALAVSLSELGRVDVGRTAELYGHPEAETIADLGDLIFEDPETETWQTADEYLSGEVRKKLAIAEASAALNPDHARNVDALRMVQPVDLRPSEISIRLGAPWVDPGIVQQFAREVLDLDGIVIRHNSDLAIWDIDWEHSRTHRPQSAFGTLRRRCDQLLSDALNSKMPKVFDTVYYDGHKSLELNAKETEAAREKMHRIKVAFGRWAWADAQRADKLVRVYNILYNDLVDRKFDGSHLTLPGFSWFTKPRPIQLDFVWQAVTTGSCYAVHKVGYGKTLAAIIAVMEQIRLGLITKPIVTVPGHTLGQWATEWARAYPGAPILVADEANFDGDRRAEFFARATTGKWTAIICTHEAFKKIPVPASFEVDLVQTLVDQYEEAIVRVEKNDKISRKRLENLKEKQEARIKKLQAHDKDDLVTIATMGVDMVVADEGQAYRKLPFATNMAGLLGVDPHGSQRAWDLYVKVRYLETKKPGRAITLLSGTPIVNTMGELFTVQRLLDEGELRRRNLHNFDAWASAFCDTTSRIELQPSGKFKPVVRMARFVNVPDVMAMFRRRASIVQSNANNQIANMPKLRRGKRRLIAVSPSDTFRRIQQSFGRRIELIEQRKGPPQKGDDILLSVINDGRLVAGDVRMFNAALDNESRNKLNTMIRGAYSVWKRSSKAVYTNPTTGEPYPRPGAAQMIFCDLGTPSMEAKRGFSPYTWIRSELIAKGVPESEIAIIHDYPTAQDKLRLRQRVDSGFVRFIIGSTGKMGTGINFQLRLLALWHFDCPWLFADLEQREGRIDRFGNQNKEFRIYVMATKGSMDATMFGACERKLTFIRAALEGDRSVRIIQDDDSDIAQLAMAKAIASGDDRLMRHAGLSNDVARLERLRAAFIDERYAIRSRIEYAKRAIADADQSIPGLELDAATVEPAAPWRIVVGDVTYEERKDGGGRLVAALAKLWMDSEFDKHHVAKYRGFDLTTAGNTVSFNGSEEFDLELHINTPSGRERQVSWSPKTTWHVLLDRLDAAVDDIRPALTRAINKRDSGRSSITDYAPRLDETFDLQEELDAKQAELDKLNGELAQEALSAKKPPQQ